MKTSWFLVLGISNTAGTLAAIIGTVGAGFFVELVGSFPGFLLLTSLLYFLAAIFYCLFATGERVNFDDPGELKYMYICLSTCKYILELCPGILVLLLWILVSLVFCVVLQTPLTTNQMYGAYQVNHVILLEKQIYDLP